MVTRKTGQIGDRRRFGQIQGGDNSNQRMRTEGRGKSADGCVDHVSQGAYDSLMTSLPNRPRSNEENKSEIV